MEETKHVVAQRYTQKTLFTFVSWTPYNGLCDYLLVSTAHVDWHVHNYCWLTFPQQLRNIYIYWYILKMYFKKYFTQMPSATYSIQFGTEIKHDKRHSTNLLTSWVLNVCVVTIVYQRSIHVFFIIFYIWDARIKFLGISCVSQIDLISLCVWRNRTQLASQRSDFAYWWNVTSKKGKSKAKGLALP